MIFNIFKTRFFRIPIVRVIDFFTPKNRKCIVLVAKKRYGYSGNLRVIGDYLASHYNSPVYLYFEGTLPKPLAAHLASCGIVHLSRCTVDTMRLVCSANTIVVDHSIRDIYLDRHRSGRSIINLWHGVAIKRIELAMGNIRRLQKRVILRTAGQYDRLIASNDVDRLAMSLCFGVPLDNIVATGLPRFDIVRKPLWTEDLKAASAQVEEMKGGKRLLLYAPTFREVGPSPFEQIGSDLFLLADKLGELGVVLGVRPHQYDLAAKSITAHPNVVVYDARQYPESNVLLRHVDILVTDYSSIWVDFLFMGRPILGLGSDRNQYETAERGFLYNFDAVFPGRWFTDVKPLIDEVKVIVEQGKWSADYAAQKALLLPPKPDESTQMIADLIVKSHE